MSLIVNFQELSKYLLAQIGVSLFKKIGETQKLLSATTIKSLMSVLILASIILAIIEGF